MKNELVLDGKQQIGCHGKGKQAKERFLSKINEIMESDIGQIAVFSGSSPSGKTEFAKEIFPSTSFVFSEFEYQAGFKKKIEFSASNGDVFIVDEAQGVDEISLIQLLKLSRKGKKIVVIIQHIDSLSDILNKFKGRLLTVFDFDEMTIESYD